MKLIKKVKKTKLIATNNYFNECISKGMKVQHYHLSSLKKNIEHLLFDLKILMFLLVFCKIGF